MIVGPQQKGEGKLLSLMRSGLRNSLKMGMKGFFKWEMIIVIPCAIKYYDCN